MYFGEKKLLFFQWASFMNRGIERALEKLGIAYDVFFYQFQDWEADGDFSQLFAEKLKEGKYAEVFSVNFSPLISNICEELGIHYVSWVYDSPIDIRDQSPLSNSCNTVYFFDRGQAEQYVRKGVAAKHLPLAADAGLLHQVIHSGEQILPMDISMVGKLYQTEYAYFTNPLDDYVKGYLEGIVASQLKVYGGYLLPELVTAGLLDRMNAVYQKASGHTFQMDIRELEYLLACEVTRRERYMALSLLSSHFKVNVYTQQADENLKRVQFCGYADYETALPKIFSASRVNLNISLKTIRSGIPLRVLEIAGCGGFVLSNYQIELDEYFQIGKECEVYQNMEDLLLKAEFYLQHEELRRQIAQAGLERVKRDFTFEERMRTMLLGA